MDLSEPVFARRITPADIVELVGNPLEHRHVWVRTDRYDSACKCWSLVWVCECQARTATRPLD